MKTRQPSTIYYHKHKDRCLAKKRALRQGHRTTLEPIRSYDEVAAILGISKQAVEQTEVRAIFKLRVALLTSFTELTGRRYMLA